MKYGDPGPRLAFAVVVLDDCELFVDGPEVAMCEEGFFVSK